MQITIECLTGSMAGKAFNFDQAEITLGRGENVKKDIDFADTDIGVSRNHGSLIVRGNRIYLNDQSRAGTLVRGQRIQGTTYELQPEDELQLGGQSGPKLRVLFQSVAKPIAPPIAPPTLPPQQSVPVPVVPVQPVAQNTVLQVPTPTPQQPQGIAMAQGEGTVIQPGQSTPPLEVKPPAIPQINTLEPLHASSETMLQPQVQPPKPIGAASDATLFQTPPTPANDTTRLQVQAQDGFQPPRAMPTPPPIQAPSDATLFQAPPMPPADATLFQSPPMPPADATVFQTPSANAGETKFQRPEENYQTKMQAQNIDTSRTILQENKGFPWVPTIVMSLLVVGVISFLIWFFVLSK